MGRFTSFAIAILLVLAAFQFATTKEDTEKKEGSLNPPIEASSAVMAVGPARGGPAILARSSAENLDERSPSISADIAREMETIEQDWSRYREEAYSQIGLTEEEEVKIAGARAKFLKLFGDLATTLNNKSGAEARGVVDAMVREGSNFDLSVEKILGEERFSYLKQSRDAFNDYLDQETRYRPRLNHDW